MARKLSARFDDIKASLERLSARERIMVGGLGAAFAFAVVFVVGYIIFSGLEEIETKNAAARKALLTLADNAECYQKHRQRTAQMELRIPRTPLELNHLVESAASAAGVSIAESAEINPVEVDRFTQRGVEIKLRKVNIEQLAKLMKQLENSPHVVQITRLNVNTRWNQHEELDVEMVVSTYERRRKQTTPKSKKGRRRRGRGRS